MGSPEDLKLKNKCKLQYNIDKSRGVEECKDIAETPNFPLSEPLELL